MSSKDGSWKTVRFGDVVRSVNDRASVESSSTRRVGLEHLDRSSLMVSEWDESGTGSSFTRFFKPGQTLFGKRRTYQRKSGYVEFEGVCSGDVLVFEAKNNYVAPEYLPLIVRSEEFHRLTLKTSVGSLSPRTNWKALAKYEFALPPLHEQRRIADLLWSFERAAQAKANALEAARQAELAALAELYDVPEWPVRRVAEAGDVQLGMKREPSVHKGADLRPYLRVANVGDDELFLDDVLEMNFAPAAFTKYVLRPNDVLLNEGQSLEYVGRAAMYRGEIEGCCFQMTLLRFRAGDEVLPEFALGWFRRCQRLGAFARVAKRTTSMAHLPAGLLSAQPIPVPPLSVQQRVVEQLEAARELRTTVAADLAQTRSLMQRTLNVLLQGSQPVGGPTDGLRSLGVAGRNME
ncbi:MULTISPECIES: restriction endonuclease subunit S [unclassified Nocardia]|uniref:restriction endonuclease subunit S n=1 Tax=unclassified Nocardia TaxID=2637762 RepID=UPI001CE3CEEA|nr:MULTISPECIES: restriction endonuclease subunit S [unclassified Nocardia]